jgi:hypothetical protein
MERLLLTGSLLLLTSCSAAILSVGGREETSFIATNSTRPQLTKLLGPPVASVPLQPPLAARSIRDAERGTELLVQYEKTTKQDGSTWMELPYTAALREEYAYKGRIQRKYEVGEAIGLAGYTVLLSELVMIPMALKTQVDRSNTLHKITVWYDAKDVAIVYLWKSEPTA